MNFLKLHISNQSGNNLNLIRLVLALGVIVYHAYPITLGLGAKSPFAILTQNQESLGGGGRGPFLPDQWIPDHRQLA